MRMDPLTGFNVKSGGHPGLQFHSHNAADFSHQGEEMSDLESMEARPIAGERTNVRDSCLPRRSGRADVDVRWHN
jgi:hypothetical protein